MKIGLPLVSAAAVLLAGVFVLPALAHATSRSQTSPHPATQSSSHRKKAHTRRGAWKRHGQQGIDPQRSREIQTALIREKYLDGEPTGKWDQRSKDAMTRYQADHGWQTKVVPDSRALISLGLGSKHENLLNPESVAAMPAIAVPGAAVPSTPRAPQRQ